MRHLIEITASDVEAAGLAVDAVLPAAWITSQAEDAEAQAEVDGHVKARLSRTGRADIVVRGTVTATVSVPCARCLKLTPVEVRGELALLLKPNPALSKAAQAKAAKTLHDKAATSKASTSKTSGASGKGASAEAAKAGPQRPRRDAPHPTKSDKGKGARVAEYEFSSEEAEHDEYDGETIVLDDFVREAILLELPNFPLCSETCTGISPRLPVPRRDAFGGSGVASAAAPVRANPFEALKHLSGGLPKGPEIDETPTKHPGDAREGDGERVGPADVGAMKARGEAKIASTHSAPARKSPSKKNKKSSAGGKAGKSAKR